MAAKDMLDRLRSPVEVRTTVPAPPQDVFAVLSDPEALADIREADRAYSSGDVVRGIDAVRALRP